MPEQTTREPVSATTRGGLSRFVEERQTLLVFAIITLALALLSPALGGGYLWDDIALVRENPLIRGFSHYRQWFLRDLFDTHQATLTGGHVSYFRPFVTFTFALDYQLGGANPTLGHAANLFLYGGCLVLVYATLRRWLGQTRGALLGLLWFALHPTRVESVAWISGRSDVLLALGLLLTLWGYRRRLERGQTAYLFVECLGSAIAYTSKETAVVLPLFYAVEAWSQAGRSPFGTSSLRRMLRAAAPQLLVAIAYLAARALWMPLRAGTSDTSISYDLLARGALFVETLGHAAALTVFPWPLLGQHGLVAASGGRLVHSPWFITLGATFLVIAGWFVVYQARRRPSIALALLLGFGAFLPTSNLAPHGLQCLFFERYLLLPHLGIAWLFAELLGSLRIAGTRVRIAVATAGLVALLFSFGYLVLERSNQYADAKAFWTHELKYNPLSTSAPTALAALPEIAASPNKLLNLLARCHKNAALREQAQAGDSCLLDLLVLLVRRTPDADTTSLTALTYELELLVEGRADTTSRPVIHHRAGDFQLKLPKRRADALLTSRPGFVPAVLAQLHSRLGHEQRALQYTEDSLAQCQDCSWSVALCNVIAAGGDYAQAWKRLDRVTAHLGVEATATIAAQLNRSQFFARQAEATSGPQQLQAKAERLVALEHYGQAYLLLAPEQEAIAPHRDAALGFAHIAFHAGYDAKARALLERHLSPTEVNQTLAQWSEKQPMFR